LGNTNNLALDDAKKRSIALFTSIFDPNRTSAITMAEFSRIINDIHEERSTLVRVLFTNSKVLLSLDRLLLASILVPFAPLLLFVVTGLSLKDLPLLGVSITSLTVAISMIFGESIKSFFAAIIFLFVTHPYDVGDRVYLGGSGNVGFFVRQMYLLSTTFERFDGYIVSFPNSLLSTMAICNVRRTGSQAQAIEVILPTIWSPDEVTEHASSKVTDPSNRKLGELATLKNTRPIKDDGKFESESILSKINKSLSDFVTKESSDFVSVRIIPTMLIDTSQLHLLIIFCHRSNFQDGVIRSILTNKFMVHLRATLVGLGLENASHLPIRPVQIPDRQIPLFELSLV
jgi:hypothetical protein